MEEIIIMDYQNNQSLIVIPNLDEVASLRITVMTGDEILKVTYKNGTEETYDSSDSRTLDYYDGAYTVFDSAAGINHLHDDAFINRHTSYSYFLVD